MSSSRIANALVLWEQWVRGRTIQRRKSGSEDWTDCRPAAPDAMDGFEYRIKPNEPRPYTLHELMRFALEPGTFFTRKGSQEKFEIKSILVDGRVQLVASSLICFRNPQELLSDWLLNGSVTCGVHS